jgi:hypothetical protein
MKYLLALAAAFAIAAVPLEQAAACSCAQMSLDEADANAQAVFAGTVVDERPVGRDEGPLWPPRLRCPGCWVA